MVKIFLAIFYSLVLLCTSLSHCHANYINGTSNFIENYLGYNATKQDTNNTELPVYKHEINETKIKEHLLDLYNLVFSFLRTNFSTYGEANVREVKNQLRSEGISKITTLAHNLNKHMNGKLNILSVTEYISKKYAEEVDAYFDSLLKQNMTCRIEEELYILNFVETVNNVFATKCRTLVNDLKHQVNGSWLQMFSWKRNEIYIVNQKSENFNYVCEKLEICRSYPAFSDYVAGLLNAILELPDGKMLTVIKIFKDILQSKADLFEYISSKKITYMLGKKLKSKAENVSDARNFFSTVREILTDRFMIFKSKDGEIKKRSKSVRILIDIFDRVYDLLGDHFILFQYKNVKKSLKKGDVKNVQMTLKNFIDIFDDIVMHYCPPETIEEVKVLIKVMIMETAIVPNKYDYLFTQGSLVNKALFMNNLLPTNVLYES